MKLVTDQCARKEIALLAMHLSGLTIEEVMRVGSVEVTFQAGRVEQADSGGDSVL